ncbi:hypothetical protein ACERC5_06695 [Streptococcus sp. E24BD]
MTWAQSDRVPLFYESFWFAGAEPMAEQVKDGLVISTYPPLWSTTYSADTAIRKHVPFRELLTLSAEWACAFSQQ